MRHFINRLWYQALLIATLIVCLPILHTQAQPFNPYDESHPLIIACDWDFPPYEFSNDDGQPDGFNIQVLTTLLTKLNIPYQFVMKEWNQAQEMFEQRYADLIIDPLYKYHGRPYILSRNILNYYQVKLVCSPNTKPVNTIEAIDLADTLVLKEGDYATGRLVDERHIENPIEYHSPKEAITGISNGKYKYFIWGKYPLKWKIKTLALDSLTLCDINIPDGEMRIVGYDKELIDLIDDEYARMEQSGELVNIRDTWFHPERIHNDTSPLALFALAGIIIATIITFLMSRLIRVRVKMAVHKSNGINSMMTNAVNMGNIMVVEYDMQSRMGRNLFGKLLPESGLVYEDILAHIHVDDQKQFGQYVHRVVKGEQMHEKFLIRWNTGTKEQPQWRYIWGKALSEAGRSQKRSIIYSLKDISQEVEETRLTQELGNKYMKVFATNLVAMSFYGKDGILIDLNDKMRKLCEFNEESERFFRNACMFDVPLFQTDFDPTSREQLHVCQRMQYPDIGIDKYIEIRISPTFDDKDQLAYYIVTARDITAEREMYLDQRHHDEELQKTNKAISHYEQRLRYLLEKSDMYVWQFTLKDMAIQFSRSLQKVEFSMSRDEYLKGMTQDEHANADQNLMEVMMKGKEFNTIHRFNYTPINPKPCWYSLSGMPTYDAEGHVAGYFGVARNITTLMQAQERLKRETARAEDSGRLKSAFLANMTHEIRTPLNAIVGFSDLLPLIDTPEERMEFIRIIRNNCDMLMRLINDILEASTMGQALAIEPAEVDFAKVFDDICQTLAQRVQEPGVEFIKDNPYDHCQTILDKGRIQQVLTNFTTNAVKYTHEGHIKIGYRWEHRLTRDEKGETDGLYFYCEDTGAGIPKEKQASVFERFVKLNDFVQGTGLGLSICQNIAERCNGHIGVTSEGEGHGSTFWMWIPCNKA